MINIKNKANLFLILILCFSVSFYAYFISKNKNTINIRDNKDTKIKESLNVSKGTTKFTDVEYKTSDNKNRNYITRGKEAYLTKDRPNLIKLRIVHSFTTLKDGTILNIKSEKADFYKNSKNIKYYENVMITNKDGVIRAEIANFFANENKIKLENNVIFKDNKNTIKGDIAELNTLTYNLLISMNNKNKRVYGQRETKN